MILQIRDDAAKTYSCRWAWDPSSTPGVRQAEDQALAWYHRETSASSTDTSPPQRPLHWGALGHRRLYGSYGVRFFSLT